MKPLGNYDYLEDDTAQASSDLFNCKVHIHTALPKSIIHKPSSKCTDRETSSAKFYRTCTLKLCCSAFKHIISWL